MSNDAWPDFIFGAQAQQNFMSSLSPGHSVQRVESVMASPGGSRVVAVSQLLAGPRSQLDVVPLNKRARQHANRSLSEGSREQADAPWKSSALWPFPLRDLVVKPSRRRIDGDSIFSALVRLQRRHSKICALVEREDSARKAAESSMDAAGAIGNGGGEGDLPFSDGLEEAGGGYETGGDGCEDCTAMEAPPHPLPGAGAAVEMGTVADDAPPLVGVASGPGDDMCSSGETGTHRGCEDDAADGPVASAVCADQPATPCLDLLLPTRTMKSTSGVSTYAEFVALVREFHTGVVFPKTASRLGSDGPRGRFPPNLMHKRGSALEVRCTSPPDKCGLIWSHDYAARCLQALSENNDVRHLFDEGMPAHSLQATLLVDGTSWTCFTCSTIGWLAARKVARRKCALEKMALRGWMIPIDSSSTVVQLDDLPLPEQYLQMAPGTTAHTFPVRTCHLTLLNGGRICLPSSLEAKEVNSYLLTHGDAGEIGRALHSLHARGVKGDHTPTLVVSQSLFALVVSNGRGLCDEWRANGGSTAAGLRTKLADSSNAMPLAIFAADANPVDSLKKNRVFLAASIMAKLNTHAKKCGRKDNGSVCEICLLPRGLTRHRGGKCPECASQLVLPKVPRACSYSYSRGGRPSAVEDLAQVVPHATVGQYVAGASEACVMGTQVLQPSSHRERSGVSELELLVPATPNARCRAEGDPLVTFPVQPSFRSLTLSPGEHDFAARVVPEYGDLRREIADVEVGTLLTLRALCPMVETTGGDFDVDARISRLCTGHMDGGDAERSGEGGEDRQGGAVGEAKESGEGTESGDSGADGRSGFVTGYYRLEHHAAKFETYEEFLDAAIKTRTDGAEGYVCARNHGSYLSEQGCGVHYDGTNDHELVLEVWGCDVCAIQTETERAFAIEKLEAMAGDHGSRVLVPDAHVALCLRRCRDVMLAHLKVWQHCSVDHPKFGRYGTAVYIG